jgi:8-oxo-dGTP diphosphatase
MQHMTLCFLLRGAPPDAVLLGYKKHGFGAGKFVGIGGRVEAAETVAAAACREVAEEIGVQVLPHDLQPRGQIEFIFPCQPAWDQTVHLFIVTSWSGEPRESEEIRPDWYSLSALPWAWMWDDSRSWLPQLLAGEHIDAAITFGADSSTVQAIQWKER